MTIGRPQIFKQIKGYQAGGITDLEVDTQPLLPPLGGSLPPAMPNNVLPLNNSLPAAPETPLPRRQCWLPRRQCWLPTLEA
jgi:hypothetical protein